MGETPNGSAWDMTPREQIEVMIRTAFQSRPHIDSACEYAVDLILSDEGRPLLIELLYPPPHPNDAWMVEQLRERGVLVPLDSDRQWDGHLIAHGGHLWGIVLPGETK